MFRSVRWRIIAVVALGFFMAALMLLQAYLQFARSFRHQSRYPFFDSRNSQFILENALYKYRQKHGNFPETIALEEFSHSNTDAWERVFQYQIVNDRVALRSLGRDGIEGGSGEDADFDIHSSPPRMPDLSLRQFLSNTQQQVLIPGCVVLGMITAAMLWSVTAATASHKSGVFAWIVAVAATFAAAWFVGLIVLTMHDPLNGH